MQRLIIDSTQASLAVPEGFGRGGGNVLSTASSELENKRAVSNSLKTKEVKWIHALGLMACREEQWRNLKESLCSLGCGKQGLSSRVEGSGCQECQISGEE